ncbi:hypothetical protein BDR26DRAFT_862864, partial [Obelidium mucronatum]
MMKAEDVAPPRIDGGFGRRQSKLNSAEAAEADADFDLGSLRFASYVGASGEPEQSEHSESEPEWIRDCLEPAPKKAGALAGEPGAAPSTWSQASHSHPHSHSTAQKHFSLWLTFSTLAVYASLHFFPFLRFFVVRLQRHASPETAVLYTAVFSVVAGLLISRNQDSVVRAVSMLSPTKETTTVYTVVGLSLLFAFHVAPRLFMGLHYICNHIPFVGVILVFFFLLVLIVAFFFLMVAAIGLYTRDVTVSLHAGLKTWFRSGDAGDGRRSSRRISLSNTRVSERVF